MPFLNEQPSDVRDLTSSVIERHSLQLCDEKEWEDEWNQKGRSSRLTEKVHI